MAHRLRPYRGNAAPTGADIGDRWIDTSGGSIALKMLVSTGPDVWAQVGGAGGPHTHADGDIPASIARDSEVTAAVAAHEGAADPHAGYVRESDPDYVDLTDGGQTTLHTHPGGAGFALTTVEVNVGSAWRRSGRFTIAGAGMTTGKPVLVRQANGPYTGKGTRADEAEMDMLNVSGKVLDATTIECFWTAQRLVRGNFKFDYAIGA